MGAMTSRLPAALGALLAAALVVAAADSPASAAGGRSDSTRLSFSFDTGPALRQGDEVRSAPRRTSGTVHTDGAALKRAKGVSGRAVRFPCLSCGRAIIEVPDRSSLDPRQDTFSFGASVRFSARQAAGSMNVVQKGWHDEPGGQYKLQVDAGVPGCVVHGSAGRVVVLGPSSVADGAWHALACQRVGAEVSLLVDGAVVATTVAESGHLANAAPVWVGGKAIGTGDPDQFRGRMDDVFVQILR